MGGGILIDDFGQDCCCPPPKPVLVACCGPGGECSDNTTEDCLLADRQPQAFGTNCENFECPGLPGGCPIYDSSCDLTLIRVRPSGLDVVHTPSGAIWPVNCTTSCPFNGVDGWFGPLQGGGGSGCLAMNFPAGWIWQHAGSLTCTGNAPNGVWIATSTHEADDQQGLFLSVTVTATMSVVTGTCPGVSPGYVVQSVDVNSPDLSVGNIDFTFFVTS